MIVRNRDWIVKEKMGAFLSVSQGSEQEPKLVEVHYDGSVDYYDEAVRLQHYEFVDFFAIWILVVFVTYFI